MVQSQILSLKYKNCINISQRLEYRAGFMCSGNNRGEYLLFIIREQCFYHNLYFLALEISPRVATARNYIHSPESSLLMPSPNVFRGTFKLGITLGLLIMFFYAIEYFFSIRRINTGTSEIDAAVRRCWKVPLGLSKDPNEGAV